MRKSNAMPSGSRITTAARSAEDTQRASATRLAAIDRSADVIAELLLGPNLGLARPACAGRSPMFDADVHGETTRERDERHRRAVEICETQCRAYAACRQVLAELDASYVGVWAGTVRLAPTTKELARARAARRAGCSA